jgi:hypothetical protein
MPRREQESIDNKPIISKVSQNAIEKALGKSVKLEPANEAPIREDFQITPPENVGSNVAEDITQDITQEYIANNSDFEGISKDEEVIIEKPKTINITPYGDNYYKIDMNDLPTRGKLYDDKSIYLRNFKVIEIKRLSTVDEETANDVINDVMSKLVKGVDFDVIAAVDKVALLFYIRMNTFPDPRYKVNFACTNSVSDGEGGQKECAHGNKLFFTANDLEINQVEETFTPNDLKFSLPNGDEILWRFPVVSDEKGVLVAVDKTKIEFENSTEYKDVVVDTDIISYSYVIESINNRPLSVMEKYLYITEVLSPQDFVVLTNEMNNKFDIGVNTMVKTTCQQCGGRVSVPVMFSPEFFLPEYTA